MKTTKHPGAVLLFYWLRSFLDKRVALRITRRTYFPMITRTISAQGITAGETFVDPYSGDVARCVRNRHLPASGLVEILTARADGHPGSLAYLQLTPVHPLRIVSK